ncbi:MAG: ribokinase [Planctomycetota bacterium]|jgi:ribokinase|nr:ribokinase [Planctomycetota bacterium]
MPKRITMIGSANVDFIMQLPHLPRRGESVTGGPFSQTFGGKGSNQALAARRAGGEVSVVAAIGGDANGRTLLETYRREGLDTSQVAVHEDLPCGTAMIFVDRAGENCIGFTFGANERLSVEQVEKAEAAIAESRVVMLQLEVPDEPMRRAIRLAKRHGAEIMLNYAPIRKTAIQLDRDISILVVNETEAGELLGTGVDTLDQAIEACGKLAGNGHRLTIVTLGANGSVVCENGRPRHCPAFAVEAKDATAAGDSYCGALAAAIAEGRETADAVRFASAAGALCASRLGAQPSIPARADIEEFMRAASK